MLSYLPIHWWPDAYHVYDEEVRLGIVNLNTIYRNGQKRQTWRAHNRHFFDVKPAKGHYFKTRQDAAASLPRQPIHHSISALASR